MRVRVKLIPLANRDRRAIHACFMPSISQASAKVLTTTMSGLVGSANICVIRASP